MHISLFFKKCASAPNTEIEFADYRLADVRRVFRKDPRVRWGAPVRQCAEYRKPYISLAISAKCGHCSVEHKYMYILAFEHEMPV